MTHMNSCYTRCVTFFLLCCSSFYVYAETGAVGATSAATGDSDGQSSANVAVSDTRTVPGNHKKPLLVKLLAPEEVAPLLNRYVTVLQKNIQVKEQNRFERLLLIRRTRQEVRDLLATEGYFMPEVTLTREAGAEWQLKVEPGPRAVIASVTIHFDGDISLGEGNDERARRRARIKRAWQLKVGRPFSQSDWDSAKTKALDSVTAHAYPLGKITTSQAAVNPDTHEVDLLLTVDSGPPFYLGDIKVTGLERLPEGFVERFSNLDKGDTYDLDALLAFQTTLQNARQFASVVVSIDRDPAHADAAPILVSVTEANSRSLSFGAGVSTNTGARLETNWRNVNLFQKGWELSTGLRLEQLKQSAYADIFLPPDGNHRDSFGFAIEDSDIEDLKTTNYALGATRTIRHGDIDTSWNLRYQYEEQKPSGAESTNLTALTLNWIWGRHAVDNVLDPRRGYLLQVELGGGAKSLLSDKDFLRSYLRYVHYLPVRKRDVFTFRTEIGVTAADGRDKIPQNFLFRAGGAHTIRGYAFNSLGVDVGEATMGGRYLGIVSAEYVNWFKPAWGVAYFIDAGDAADNRRDFKTKLGYGIGGRWRSPVGPVAVDVAYGQDDKQLRLHFGIGVAF